MIDAERRLSEWGRWCRSGSGYGHCLSAEHWYRSPQIWHPESPRGDPPDERRCWEVEIAVRSRPDRERKALKFRYVYAWTEDQCCRRLRLHSCDWRELLGVATNEICTILERSALESIDKAVNRNRFAA